MGNLFRCIKCTSRQDEIDYRDSYGTGLETYTTPSWTCQQSSQSDETNWQRPSVNTISYHVPQREVCNSVSSWRHSRYVRAKDYQDESVNFHQLSVNRECKLPGKLDEKTYKNIFTHERKTTADVQSVYQSRINENSYFRNNPESPRNKLEKGHESPAIIKSTDNQSIKGHSTEIAHIQSSENMYQQSTDVIDQLSASSFWEKYNLRIVNMNESFSQCFAIDTKGESVEIGFMQQNATESEICTENKFHEQHKTAANEKICMHTRHSSDTDHKSLESDLNQAGELVSNKLSVNGFKQRDATENEYHMPSKSQIHHQHRAPIGQKTHRNNEDPASERDHQSPKSDLNHYQTLRTDREPPGSDLNQGGKSVRQKLSVNKTKEQHTTKTSNNSFSGNILQRHGTTRSQNNEVNQKHVTGTDRKHSGSETVPDHAASVKQTASINNINDQCSSSNNHKLSASSSSQQCQSRALGMSENIIKHKTSSNCETSAVESVLKSPAYSINQQSELSVGQETFVNRTNEKQSEQIKTGTHPKSSSSNYQRKRSTKRKRSANKLDEDQESKSIQNSSDKRANQQQEMSVTSTNGQQSEQSKSGTCPKSFARSGSRRRRRSTKRKISVSKASEQQESEHVQKVFGKEAKQQKKTLNCQGLLAKKSLQNVITNNFQCENWSCMPCIGEVTYIQLKPFSDESKGIIQLFSDTTINKGFCITRIKRIQNPYLWGCYRLKKEEMENRNKQHGIAVQELRLFHGTKERNIASICENNLNWRRSGTSTGNEYGKGVCFSPIAYYAHHYTDKNPSAENVMLLCKVLVSLKITGNRAMVLPSKDEKTGVYFDTSIKSNEDVFVKYTDNEFYPEYLVYYCI